MDNSIINRFHFTSGDYDEFGAMLKVAFVEEKLLEAGTFKGTVNIVSTTNVVVGNFHINRKVLQLGSSMPGFITFTIWEPKTKFSWRNQEMREGMIGVLWNREHQSITGGGFKGLPISINEDYFFRLCISKGYSGLINKLKNNELLFVPESNLIEIRQLVLMITQDTSLTNEVIQDLIENNLVQRLLDSLVSTISITHPAERTHSKFELAIDYMHANLSELTSVSQVCNDVDINERTLRRLIQNKYDISPKNYLNRLRLNEVRKAIKNDNEDHLIKQLASEYNFWHMGQFTRDYKILFGELPSKTMAVK